MRFDLPLCLTMIAAVGAGCGSESGDYIIVTVDKRPAVNDIKTLKVKLSNAGSERSDDLDLGGKSLPATFSVSAPGRTGDLGIEVSALDAGGQLVGRGSTMTTIEMPSANVLVDTADFVVNTEFADDQLLSNYFAANGFQLSGTTDGNWAAIHSARCSTPCNVFARRFDSNGRAINSTAAAGTNEFVVSSKLTTFFSTPAIAGNGTTTMAVWNGVIMPMPATPPNYTIDCRTFDAMGAAMQGGQLTLSTDEFPNLVSVAPLSNGNFSVAWEGRVTASLIRSAVVKPDCTVLAPGVLSVSTITGAIGPQRSHSAASADRIMYAWLLDNNVHVRVATNANTFLSNDTQIIAKTATEQPEHVRVAPLPGGNFAIFTRWSLITGSTGPGRIEMVRANNAGVPMGAPVVITTRSGSDFASSESFGVAAAADGSIMVVWSSCLTNGDDSNCGVFGRLVSSAGMPVGTELQLNTTTKDDQTGPSAVALPGSPTTFVTAWTDKSQLAPDTAGAAVRARIIYPADGGN